MHSNIIKTYYKGAQDDLELPNLQPVPPDRWDDSYMLLCMGAGISNLALCMPGGQALYCSELRAQLQPQLGTVGTQKVPGG